MSKKGNKIAILTGVSVLLLALVASRIAPLRGSDASREGRSPTGGRDERMQVRTEIVHTEKLGGRVTTVGTLLSNEEVEVRSQVSGQVRRIYFKEGSRLKKDDLLVKINDDELQAQLLRAQSRLAIAEQQAERQRQLFEKEFISQEEYHNVVNELNIAKAEAQLIRAQIEKTEIRAPFNSTVGLRFVSEGSYISPATIITTLQDNSRMKMDFTIPEKYAAEIKVGDRITFRVQGRREQFEGTIYSLDARLDQTTRTLRVRAFTPNPKGLLLPGSFATVEVLLNEREALTVPSYALIPELRGHKVFLYKSGKVESRAVEIGNRSEERVEIVEGLHAGDTLITSGLLQLRPEVAVRPIENRSLEVQ